jgi:hypothetical protein
MKKAVLRPAIKKLTLAKETVTGMDGTNPTSPPSNTLGSGNSECDCGTARNCMTSTCPPAI